MPRATVVDVLACLGDEFQEFAEGFSRGEYLLWLGSGLSRDVVPNVAAIVERMLEFLRTNIENPEARCRFSRALDEVLDVAGVPTATRASLDYSIPVVSWPAIEDIVGRLVDRYADVLNVQVQDEDEDFLVWEGLDVPRTYGAPELEPDVEHFCVALLMLEGVVRAAPTTNWDGLVEPTTYAELREMHTTAAQAVIEQWAPAEHPPEPTWEILAAAHHEVEKLQRQLGIRA